MYRCEVYRAEPNGSIRIANVRIPRPVRRGELDQGMRLVSIQLNQPGGNPTLNLNCGIPRNAEVTEILGGLRYNTAAVDLVDPRKYRVYSSAEIEAQKAGSNDIRQVEKSWLSRPRQSSLTALTGQASSIMYDCITDGGECIGGMTTTADPYNNNGPNSGNSGGAGDGGLDGYMGRTEEEFVLSVDEDPPCTGSCNTPPPPENVCDELNPPPGGCMKKFDSFDTTAIFNALAAHARTDFTDSAAKEMCRQMAAFLRQAVEMNFLQRGVNNAAATGETNGHNGQSGASYGHLDPRVLDPAINNPSNAYLQKKLLNTGLHESLHLNGFPQHAASEGKDKYNPYVTKPYDQLNDPTVFTLNSANPNSCVRW